MSENSSKIVFKLGVRQKVLLVLMLVLLTSLSISGWFALQEERENMLKEVDQRGSDISRFAAKSLAYSVVGYDYHTIDLLLNEIVKSNDVGYSKVVNKKGNTMAEAGIVPIKDSTNMVLFKENIRVNNDVVGTLTLGISTDKTMRHLEEQKFSLIKREALIILLIVFGEFVALSIIIIKPVGIMSKFIRESERDEGVSLGTIPINSNDEFGELANQFNELSKNLNNANAELRTRVDYADEELIKTNNLLLDRSRELMELNEEFKKLSITDSLTGLFNRRYFEETLAREIDLAKRHGDIISVLVLDIDKFKNVNDTYGHMHGDNVIKMIAIIMKERLRDSDVLSRFGGEEFVIVCRNTSRDNSIYLAEELRKTVEQQVTCSGKDEIKVTISIGIVTVDKGNIGDYADNMFKFADIALYHSKEHGRNLVTHYDDIA